MLTTPYVTSYLSEYFEEDTFPTLDGYESRGGYRASRRAWTELEPDALVSLVEDAGLRARSGSGAPVGSEWSALTSLAGETSLVCRAGETEPGAFRHPLILERGAHLLLEGILIAARAIRAARTFVCVRAEHRVGAARLEQAVGEARARGYLGADVMGTGQAHDVVVTLGAGGHPCVEETSLLSQLEGRRGEPPRGAAPEPPARLFGHAVRLDDAETLCHLPHIVEHGAQWFRGYGTAESPGTTLFSVSGHVTRPGVYELPLGTPLDELVFEHAGGVPRGRRVKGVIVGGPQAPVVPAGHLTVPMANESLGERGARLGAGSVVVMDERTCMVRVAALITGFHRDASCGRCTASREGAGWLHKLVSRIERGAASDADLETCDAIAGSLGQQPICEFARASARPLLDMLRHFREEFEAHVRDGKCAFSESFGL